MAFKCIYTQIAALFFKFNNIKHLLIHWCCFSYWFPVEADKGQITCHKTSKTNTAPGCQRLLLSASCAHCRSHTPWSRRPQGFPDPAGETAGCLPSVSATAARRWTDDAAEHLQQGEAERAVRCSTPLLPPQRTSSSQDQIFRVALCVWGLFMWWSLC